MLFRSESHGPALGCVVDGCPPGIALTPEMIQAFLDKRRPGQSRFTTQRQEPDQVKILSGVFEDDRTGGPVTTGTPIMLMIENVDQRSKDYAEIRDKFRPGHADLTYQAKYGIRDYRGGGRSSARETAARVAAGAVAKKLLVVYLGMVPTYSVVYGAFATLPIMLVWIYLAWIIVLMGAGIPREIPAALFAAVAQVLAYVYQLRSALAGRSAMPGELPELHVPAELDPHNKPGAHPMARSNTDEDAE